MESITMIEACPMCHGPIKHDHKCESSFTCMKITIDLTYSDDNTKQAVASGFDTKRAVASDSGTRRAAISGFGTKRVVVSVLGTKHHQAMTASGFDTILDAVKEMLHSVIEKMHILK
ncbi:hypothetical protein GUJ93_ZPchr0005g15160 [Zizania palustris]|uniref:Uncharacterized protein n=1 Tax=Zizania palustris TaxID=103762 RepID=A0A8J5STY2_ZIZPA|nr:hypothetical protein GUJ93_ZPchr0005g15160 [Zizania palustris]